MSWEFIASYGQSIEAPNSMSVIIGAPIPYLSSETVYTRTDAAEAEDIAQNAGSWNIVGEMDTNLFAAVMADVIGATLGNGNTVFGVTLNELTDTIAGENMISEFKDYYGYGFGPVVDSPVFSLIPDAVIGFHGRTIPKNGTRMYKWGLFSQEVAGLAGLAERASITVPGWQTTIAPRVSGFYGFYFLVKQCQPLAVSSASSLDSNLVNVVLTPQVRHGVRRD